MNYDAWKTRSPDDDYYDDDPDPELCAHEEYEVNWEGRAECHHCGETWWATSAQIEADRQARLEHAKWQRQQDRREFWRKVTLPVRWPIYRLLEKIWPRKSCSVLTDDEIPF